MRNKYLILMKEDEDGISIGFREESNIVNENVKCNYHLFRDIDIDVDIIKETNGYSYIISSLSPKSCVERFPLIYDFQNFNILHVKHEIKSSTIKLVKIKDLNYIMDKMLEDKKSFIEEEYLLINWLKSNLDNRKLEDLQDKLKLLDSLIQNDRNIECQKTNSMKPKKILFIDYDKSDDIDDINMSIGLKRDIKGGMFIYRLLNTSDNIIINNDKLFITLDTSMPHTTKNNESSTIEITADIIFETEDIIIVKEMCHLQDMPVVTINDFIKIQLDNLHEFFNIQHIEYEETEIYYMIAHAKSFKYDIVEGNFNTLFDKMKRYVKEEKSQKYNGPSMDNLHNLVNEMNSEAISLSYYNTLQENKTEFDYIIKDLSSLVNLIDDSIMAKLTLINDNQKVNSQDIDSLKLLNILSRRINTNLTLIKTIKIKSESVKKEHICTFK